MFAMRLLVDPPEPRSGFAFAVADLLLASGPIQGPR
jgi:hypothetical protein